MDTLNITEEIKKLEQARKNTNNKREDVRLKAIILKLQGMKVVDIAKKFLPQISFLNLLSCKYYHINL